MCFEVCDDECSFLSRLHLPMQMFFDAIQVFLADVNVMLSKPGQAVKSGTQASRPSR